MTLHLGVIAEDNSDIDVFSALFKKLYTKPFKIHKFAGYGCGKIRGKCRDWAQNLQARGCTALVVVHDLDDKE